MPGPAIVADGLVKTYGRKVRALDGVSLEVPNAARSLILGDEATPQQRELLLGGGSTGSLVLQSLLWTLGIGVLFGVLCTRRYRGLDR